MRFARTIHPTSALLDWHAIDTAAGTSISELALRARPWPRRGCVDAELDVCIDIGVAVVSFVSFVKSPLGTVRVTACDMQVCR